MKINWRTRGTWDCCTGGCSPEAPHDTPVPPFSGYTEDEDICDIQVHYVAVTKQKDEDLNAKVNALTESNQELNAKVDHLTEMMQQILKAI